MNDDHRSLFFTKILIFAAVDSMYQISRNKFAYSCRSLQNTSEPPHLSALCHSARLVRLQPSTRHNISALKAVVVPLKAPLQGKTLSLQRDEVDTLCIFSFSFLPDSFIFWLYCLLVSQTYCTVQFVPQLLQRLGDKKRLTFYDCSEPAGCSK